ncbi:MAG: hypothetical protein A2X86_20900 [Bdellovibrionales bacterium GWA2_49_15]|nr:MAG: hypothetical protein A2X86_20900 [Bdellovibrionales bacterium GWA2_49_15]HAZ14837.1 hypothetical protein [Bdellovibrionales bacterium]
MINFLVAFITFLFLSNSYAGYSGRFISGAFISKEVFRDSQVDRYNDVAILSERLYLNFDDLIWNKAGFTLDVRDKENFFDKMDRERQTLTEKNKLQLHQFSFHKPAESNEVDFSVGRFPLPQAGAIYLDGLDFGLRKNLLGLSAKFSLFYGLNPQLAQDTGINRDVTAYGGHFTLENKGKSWERYFFSINALVRQVYKTEVDRFYYYNNTNLQSDDGQNFSSILYLDFLPHVYVQNFWSTYATNFSNRYKLRASFSTIDSLHYVRVQDIRETLPSSRYHQSSLSIRSPSDYGQTSYETKLSVGLREVDKKNMAELKFGALIPRIIKDEISGTANLGVKKNFISNDLLLGLGLLHSNNFRELSINQDVQFEQRASQKPNIAYISEGSYTKFFNRSLFGIISIQNIRDNYVSIFSIMLKISYRFGQGGQAPIREGSPPMGQL